jgi:biopolymer transport protein ExbD
VALNFGPEADDEVLSTINTTPLVDVMLVLLIIFLITIPVVNTALSVQLPHERSEHREARPEQIVVSIDAAGGVHAADGQPIPEPELTARLTAWAARRPQPELHLLGDRAVRYEHVGRVLRAAKAAGIAQVAFVTEPSSTP